MVFLKGEVQAIRKIAVTIFLFREMDDSSGFQVAETWEEDSSTFFGACVW